MKRSAKTLTGLTLAMSAGVLGVIMPTAAHAVTFGLSNNSAAADNATFSKIVQQVVNIVLFIAGAAAMLYMVYSGFQYVTAGGDDDKATTARKGLINAIIGLIIVASAYLIFGATRKAANTAGTGTVTSGEL